MSLRVCLGCRTLYADGLKACPQCGTHTRDALYDWEDDAVKASEHGATYYVPKGGEVPAELGDDVRLVGPGAPKPKAERKPAEPKAEPEPAEPKAEAPKAERKPAAKDK